MRAATSLMQHMLRQHAAQMYRQPSLQGNLLFSVLPHLLRSEVCVPVDVSGSCVTSAFGFATQAAQSQFKRTDFFNTHPRSLQYDRATEEPRPEVSVSRFRQALLTIAGFYSKESQLLRVFEIQKKFASEYNMLCLHIWMLLVRLRSEGKDGKDLAQMIYELFQDNVEARVRAEGVKVRLNKWLNELEQMFYGMSFAFDKSLTGDENITNSLLRNIYGDDKSKQKAAELLARYVTRELACLAKTESEHILAGRIKFSDELFRK